MLWPSSVLKTPTAANRMGISKRGARRAATIWAEPPNWPRSNDPACRSGLAERAAKATTSATSVTISISITRGCIQ
ncbi:hypothetical protein C7I55_10225 [Sphingomonas deserti]|uniref:Uncharacterized protein n=1 Tax=Allosphingosinicella deserti TaxID=2116704 RepID=A0A2P7QRU1_9SPHN|nr:hypothetical protein C7I55_10225 [Sphingomonas deserti]